MAEIYLFSTLAVVVVVVVVVVGHGMENNAIVRPQTWIKVEVLSVLKLRLGPELGN